MKASDLKGLPVVTSSDENKVGTVDEVLLDQQLQHVVGFRIKRGLLGPHARVRRDAVSAIDANGMRVPDSSSLKDEDAGAETDGVVPFDHAKGTHVTTESGTALGTIGDIHLDIDARQVIAYTLTGSLGDRLKDAEPSILAEYALRRDEGGTLIVADAADDEVNRPDWKNAQGYIER